MFEKLKRASKYLIYSVYTNIIFGLIYYFLFTWLVEYSLLYAYLGSIGLILIGLLLDHFFQKSFISKEGMAKNKQLSPKEKKIYNSIMSWILDSFVSFKTILFIFYFFILIVSQIINIEPSLAGAQFSKFISANSYGIVLIIAFDRIVAQFSRDRKRVEREAETFRETMTDEEE